MKKINKKIIRRYIFPAFITAAAVAFWFYYDCSASAVWLVLLGGILLGHLGVFYLRQKKEKEIQAELPEASEGEY